MELAGLDVDILIREMVLVDNRSHLYVSEALKAKFPDISRGLSSRSIRRYCAANGIHRTSRLPEDALDRVVRTSIQKVLCTSKHTHALPTSHY